MIGWNYINILLIKKKSKYYQKAMLFIKKAIEFESTSLDITAINYIALGHYYFMKGNADKSAKFYWIAQEICYENKEKKEFQTPTKLLNDIYNNLMKVNKQKVVNDKDFERLDLTNLDFKKMGFKNAKNKKWEQLSNANTLYGAINLSPEIQKKLEKEFPQFFTKPKPDERN